MTFTGLPLPAFGFFLMTLASISAVSRQIRELSDPTARQTITQSSNYTWLAFTAVAIGGRSVHPRQPYRDLHPEPGNDRYDTPEFWYGYLWFTKPELHFQGSGTPEIRNCVGPSGSGAQLANITSVALATAIVTAIMASMGYPPSLGDVSGAPHAFISSLRTAFLAMVALLMVGIAMSLLKGERVEEIPAPAPQTQARESSSV